MRGVLLWATLALAGLAGGHAHAIVLDPPELASCLTSKDPKQLDPEYPLSPLQGQRGAVVKAQFDFDGPDAAPRATLDIEAADKDREAFEEAVKQYAQGLRLPCMARGAPEARLEVTYRFEPDRRRVSWGDPQDPRAARTREALKCLTHEDDRQGPAFPKKARRESIQGRVLTRLRFTAADRPPEVQAQARPWARVLEDEVRLWAQGLRLPCHGGEPVDAEYTYQFVFEGEAYGARPMLLQQLLGAVRGVRQQQLDFDTATMGCPFDLRLHYSQPFRPNRVGEVGGSDPARRPLLAWLRGIELDAPAKALDAVFGDTFTVTVPCLKIDIQPEEK